MQKIGYGLTCILFVTLFTGCGTATRSYLYKPGATSKTMASDYKECKFKSTSLNQNNQIVHNIADGFIKDSKNASQYKVFMTGCINQKGYEWYAEGYMRTVENFDADVYKNRLQGFFYSTMYNVDIVDYIKKGNTYHSIGSNGKEIKMDEEWYLKEKAKYQPD